MRYGFSEACLAHDPGARHPETPDRVHAVRRGLNRRHGVEYVEADPAKLEAIEAVHDPEYVAELREFCEEGGGDWDPDTVATPETWPAALASAGLAVWAAEEALSGAGGRRTPFSLGRPPGHHATDDDAMGFCFLNNAAVAAAHARRAAGRVAVLDWDVHHGNGTQDIFFEDGDVLYLSAHESGLYPGTGAADETGAGEGAGATVNVPLPPGAGDPAYRLVFESVFEPAIARFDPELLLVSAGFDAHRNDPISRLHVTTEGYGMLAHRVERLADEAGAGLGFVLEGGYSLESLAESVGMVHETFDGREAYPEEGDPDRAVTELVADIQERHGLGSK